MTSFSKMISLAELQVLRFLSKYIVEVHKQAQTYSFVKLFLVLAGTGNLKFSTVNSQQSRANSQQTTFKKRGKGEKGKRRKQEKRKQGKQENGKTGKEENGKWGNGENRRRGKGEIGKMEKREKGKRWKGGRVNGAKGKKRKA